MPSGEEASSEFKVISGAERLAGRDEVFSSWTMDCLLVARCSSSSSSAISINLRLRRELVDDEVDPEAACNEQAAESLVSFSSLASAMSNVVL